MSDPTYSVFVKKLDAFKDWLTARGAEILPTTNEWEVLRFQTGNPGASIVYKNKHNHLRLTGESAVAWRAFVGSRPWRAIPATARRRRSSPDCAALRERDGDDCFFCHISVAVEDESAEHLVAVTHGGPDHLANKALAHRLCNEQAGHLSLMEKIRMREAALVRLYTPGTLPNPLVQPADETTPPWDE